jgi:hypothetical protein
MSWLRSHRVMSAPFTLGFARVGTWAAATGGIVLAWNAEWPTLMAYVALSILYAVLGVASSHRPRLSLVVTAIASLATIVVEIEFLRAGVGPVVLFMLFLSISCLVAARDYHLIVQDEVRL